MFLQMLGYMQAALSCACCAAFSFLPAKAFISARHFADRVETAGCPAGIVPLTEAGCGVGTRLNFCNQAEPLGLLLSISVPGDGAVAGGFPAGVTAGFGIGLVAGVVAGIGAVVAAGLGMAVTDGLGIGVACASAVCIGAELHSVTANAQAATTAVKMRGVALFIGSSGKKRILTNTAFPIYQLSSREGGRLAADEFPERVFENFWRLTAEQQRLVTADLTAQFDQFVA